VGDSRKADTLILEAQFDFAPDTSMSASARATLDAAQRFYGQATATLVESAFQARGIL
jgi:zinc metalloprotease ZmpB